MQIKINKDYERDFKEIFLKGFTFKESCAMAGAIACYIGAVWGLIQLGLKLDYAVLVAIPTLIPCIGLGFWKSRAGLSFLEFIKVKGERKKYLHLSYQNMEYEQALKKAEDDWQEQEREVLRIEKHQQKELKQLKAQYRRNYRKRS